MNKQILCIALFTLYVFLFNTLKLSDIPKIVFLGDSITDEAGWKYSGFVKRLQRDVSDYRFIAVGRPGARAPELFPYLEKALSHQPQHLVIFIGINDVWHFAIRGQGTAKDIFKKSLQQLITKSQEHDVGVTLCTPTLIGEYHNGENDLDYLLEEYAQIIRDVAHNSDVDLVDLRKAFIKELKRINTESHDSRHLTYDGVHLSPEGDALIATTFLQHFKWPVHLKQRTLSQSDLFVWNTLDTPYKLPDLMARVHKEVIVKNPKRVVLLNSINDIWYFEKGKSTPGLHGTALDQYNRCLGMMVKNLSRRGIEVMLCTPLLIGERHDGSNPQDAQIERYAQVIHQVARRSGAQVIDLRQIFINKLKQENPQNLSKGIYTKDGIHLNDKGQELLNDVIQQKVFKP